MPELDPIDLAVHRAKVQVHRALRFAADRRAPLRLARQTRLLVGLPERARVHEQLRGLQLDPREQALELGKLENLRVAAQRLHGLEFEAGQAFSFWAQVGPPLRARGFVEGRELREGCVVPGIGGGLCLLSNGLYRAAMAAEFEMLERHAHSRRPPGSRAALGEDATVAWNYVDLRFVAPTPWRLEVRMDAELLHVVIRAQPRAGRRAPVVVEDACERAERGRSWAGEGGRSCLSCERACSRAVSASAAPRVIGRRSWLVDAAWPEFVELLRAEGGKGERVLQPIDGARLGLSRYAWPQAPGLERVSFPARTVLRSLRARQLAAQGPARQRAMLADDARLAAAMARALEFRDAQLVVSQTLLPHLQLLGVLGGRHVQVLMQRLPLFELQARLDEAREHNPQSPTLADFRADPRLVEAEAEALEGAAELLTPHTGIAACFPGRARLLPWARPESSELPRESAGRPLRLLFPASTVGRKGAWELRAALGELLETQGAGLRALLELRIAGRELEGPGFWAGLRRGIDVRAGCGSALADIDAVVLPAWVEHEPRVLLRALARGIPVIASAACGLPSQSGAQLIAAGDVASLRAAIAVLLGLGSSGAIRRNLGG